MADGDVLLFLVFWLVFSSYFWFIAWMGAGLQWIILLFYRCLDSIIPIVAMVLDWFGSFLLARLEMLANSLGGCFRWFGKSLIWGAMSIIQKDISAIPELGGSQELSMPPATMTSALLLLALSALMFISISFNNRNRSKPISSTNTSNINKKNSSTNSSSSSTNTSNVIKKNSSTNSSTNSRISSNKNSNNKKPADKKINSKSNPKNPTPNPKNPVSNPKNPVFNRFQNFQHSAVYAPIQGVYDNDKNPLLPIDIALDRLPFDFGTYLWGAKQWVKTRETQDKIAQVGYGFTEDMAMSLWLYTAESDLYKKLNDALRKEDRSSLREHYFPFLRIVMTALNTLKAQQGDEIKVLNRGVRLDLVQLYPEFYMKDNSVVWWELSSTTSDIEVLQSPFFLGQSGERTLFQIQTKKGISVSQFSAEPAESECILPPGTPLKITGILPKDDSGQTIILCEDENIDSLLTT